METVPDHDVDMDAPQISTLHQEDSPPPPPRRVKAVKLLVKDNRAASGQGSPSRKRPLSDYDEEEDEEDQLIDDDDVVPPSVVAPVATPAPVADAPPKRKAPAKRKPRKNDKKAAEEERKSKEKIMPAGATSLAPTMSWFEVSTAKAHEQVGQMGTLDVGHVPLNTVVSLDTGAGPSKPPPKKRKPPAVPRVRAKPGPKPKVPPAAAVLLPPLPDEIDVASEAGYSVTAASSPITAHFDGNTPEPESFPPYTNGPLNEEPAIPVNLQDVALPQYPLPVKPFSVQPPQKINTGFAPIVPLDRTGAKVRHWRVVNREIRGIAGGRWFTRSWMGEKESPLAIAIASGAGDKTSSSSVALPKLPTSMSISSTPTKTKARATKNSSLTGSAAPSRSSSAVPSKMRTIMLAPTAPPSEGGDSDMVAAPGS